MEKLEREKGHIARLLSYLPTGSIVSNNSAVVDKLWEKREDDVWLTPGKTEVKTTAELAQGTTLYSLVVIYVPGASLVRPPTHDQLVGVIGHGSLCEDPTDPSCCDAPAIAWGIISLLEGRAFPQPLTRYMAELA